MIPDGPIPAVVGRLPLARPPTNLTADPGNLGRDSLLRLALAEARGAVAGVGATEFDDTRSPGHTRFALADTIVEPLRRHLRLPLPVRWNPTADIDPVSVDNSDPPAVVLGPSAQDLSVPELRFRLARAATQIAMGLAPVASGVVSLAEMLEALGRMISPAHEVTSARAKVIADRISKAGLHRHLTSEERAALASELSHWLHSADRLAPLESELERFEHWYATRLSGQLDGALSYLAVEQGLVLNTGTPDPAATLRTDAAQWLLRGLQLYSSG
jgi:hypothetical protein